MSYFRNYGNSTFDASKIEVVAEIGKAEIGLRSYFNVSVIKYDGGAPKISVLKYVNDKVVSSKLGWLDAPVATEVAGLIQTAAFYVEALPQPKVAKVVAKKVDPKVEAAKAKAAAALAKLPKRVKRFAVGS